MAFRGPDQKVTEVMGPPAVKHSFSGSGLTMVTTPIRAIRPSCDILGAHGDRLCQSTRAKVLDIDGTKGLPAQITKGHRMSDAPRLSTLPRVLRQNQCPYSSGGMAFVQTSPPPLGWNRTTASETEQKERTPVWLGVSGFALTAYPVNRVPPTTGA